MMRSYLQRTVYEKRGFILGWGAVYAFMSALVVSFYPSFKTDGSLDTLIASMPEQMRGFIGDPSVFSTIPGYIATQVYDIRLSLIIAISTLVLAVGLSLKDEESGDMRTTLSTSLSRDRLFLEKFFAASVILTLFNFIVYAAVYLSLLGLSESVPHELLIKSAGLGSLFSIAAFAIPFSIGMATGKRAVTMVIGLIVAIGSYILTTFSRTVEWLKDWSSLSLMHYFDTDGLRTGEFSMLNVWVLVFVILLAVCIGLLCFRRRDIA